jgi:hypothetical protein
MYGAVYLFIYKCIYKLGQLVFYSFDSDAKEEWPQSGGWIRHIICLDHNNKESTQEKVSRTPKVDMVNWTRMQKKKKNPKKTKKELRTAGGSRKHYCRFPGPIHIGIVFQIPLGFTPSHQIYKTLRVTISKKKRKKKKDSKEIYRRYIHLVINAPMRKFEDKPEERLRSRVDCQVSKFIT